MHKKGFPLTIVYFAFFIATGCSPALKECVVVERYSSENSIETVFATHRSTLLLIGGNIYTCPCEQTAQGREIAGITEARNRGGAIEARMASGEVEARKHAGDNLGRMTGGAVEARRTGGAAEVRISGGDTEARKGGGAAEQRTIDAVVERRSYEGLVQKVMCYQSVNCSGFALSGITGHIKYFNGDGVSSISEGICIDAKKQ